LQGVGLFIFSLRSFSGPRTFFYFANWHFSVTPRRSLGNQGDSPGMTDRCVRSFALKFETLSGHAVHVVRYVSMPEGHPEVSLADTEKWVKERGEKHTPLPSEIEGRQITSCMSRQTPSIHGLGEFLICQKS